MEKRGNIYWEWWNKSDKSSWIIKVEDQISEYCIAKSSIIYVTKSTSGKQTLWIIEEPRRNEKIKIVANQ